MSVKTQLWAGESLVPVGVPLLEALERMHCGGIILNAAGEVIRLNSAAERYLRKYAGLSSAMTSSAEWTSALHRLFGTGEGHVASDADLRVPVAENGKPQLVLQARRVPSASDEGALTVITLVDLTEPSQPSAETLQRLFGLTAAETKLALAIARGLRLREAAEALGMEMPTATAQMTSIFAKTGTQQQGELVALLSRLTVLS